MLPKFLGVLFLFCICCSLAFGQPVPDCAAPTCSGVSAPVAPSCDGATTACSGAASCSGRPRLFPGMQERGIARRADRRERVKARFASGCSGVAAPSCAGGAQ
jgi:hypothetical protein